MLQTQLTAQWSELMASPHDGSDLAEIWLKGHHDFDSLDAIPSLGTARILGASCETVRVCTYRFRKNHLIRWFGEGSNELLGT